MVGNPGLPNMSNREQKSAAKLMLIGFGDAKDVLLKDDLPNGNTINGQHYADLLTKLRKAMTKKTRDSMH